jgi:UDP-glucose:(heptosyl)LPS alpha-1,3-glucosyltransferase
MDIGLCYESVLPARGGCETYITGLARRLAQDGHSVHLYATRWDEAALPATLHYHPVKVPLCPRFLRPWFFGAACLRALDGARHDVTIGFDKIWGLDVLYPQGGLYLATADHNMLKYPRPATRELVRALKVFDPAHHSFAALERHQYVHSGRAIVIAISEMVRRHFREYYDLKPDNLRLVRIATDPQRFDETDRPCRRAEYREKWGLRGDHVVALFCGMNYRLKGLEPLLRALHLLPAAPAFRLLVAGHPQTVPYERLARRLGVADRVRFVGYCHDMRNCYFAADFFVHPTFYDPCSHVVLEAMACGLPVITSRYNGASELMSPPREGLLIDDPHDHRRLASAIAQMLDSGRRSTCAQAARRAATRWTFEHHYRQMLAVLAEAAARKKQAA